MAAYNETITEDVTNSEDLLTGFLHNLLVNINTTSAFQVMFPVAFTEAMTVDDSALAKQIVRLLEHIDIADVVSAAGSTYHVTRVDIMEIADLSSVLFSHSFLEEITANDTPVGIIKKLQIILDQIKIYEDVSSKGTLYTALAVAMALNDIAGQIDAITDGVALDDLLVQNIIMALQVIEAVDLQDVEGEFISFFTLVEDDLTGDDSISHSASLHDLIVDGWEVTTKFIYDSETYTGWVLNPENYALSNYSNYSFNSSTYFAYSVLLANSTGLFAMDTDTDNGSYITSRLKTASMQFGTSSRKQIPEVLLGVNNTGKVILTVSVDGQSTAYYELIPSTDFLDTQQIKVGKGLHGRYWQFELVTKENSTFDLDTFEFLPVVFGRKLR